MNRDAFLTFIQPAFSQVVRFVVSPFITYVESVIITSGMKWGVVCIAAIMAISSPIWLECLGPRCLYSFVLVVLMAEPYPSSALGILLTIVETGSIDVYFDLVVTLVCCFCYMSLRWVF